jgi:hypothetical protein
MYLVRDLKQLKLCENRRVRPNPAEFRGQEDPGYVSAVGNRSRVPFELDAHLVASRPLTSTQLHKMLVNPYYKGVVTFQGVSYPGRHEAIVDTVTWQRVQEVLSTHAVGEKERNYPHYLKGSVVCAECGSRLIIQHSRNRHGTIYEYFVCSGRHEKRNPCTQSAIPVGVVEERVVRLYQTIALAPELRGEVEAALREELTTSTKEAQKVERDLNLEKARLQARERKLLEGHLDGVIPGDLYKSEQLAISSTLASIEGRLQNANAQLEELEDNLKTALDLVEDCYHAYVRASDRIRRAFNQAFFERIEVGWEGEVAADLAEPFQIIWKRVPGKQPFETRSPKPQNQIALRRMDWAQGSREQLLVPLEGLEPPTLSLGRNCSSIELQRLTHRVYWRGQKVLASRLGMRIGHGTDSPLRPELLKWSTARSAPAKRCRVRRRFGLDRAVTGQDGEQVCECHLRQCGCFARLARQEQDACPRSNTPSGLCDLCSD